MKTPDYKVYKDGILVFYCEVKSIQKDMWLDKDIEKVPPGTIVGGERNDPIFNRLSDDIHSAVKQFDAVNPDEAVPNVLFLINHDNSCDHIDLLGVLTGNVITDKGKSYPIYKQFSEGRIKNEKGRIHLFIWLDDFYPEQFLFSQSNQKNHETLCQLFGVKQDDIRQS